MHCKDVSLHEVGIALTPDGIAELMKDWTSYMRTEVVVLRNGDAFASVRVTRYEGTGLFRKVKEFEILSLPADTVYVEDGTVDVVNVPAQAKLQSEHPGMTVVVKGMFGHINVIKDMGWKELTVMDTVPPEPSKLGVLVRRALDSGLVTAPVVVTEKTIDIAAKVSDVKTEAVMFPCRTSGISADIPVYFLDGHPDPGHEVTLIGCNLSKRIFAELYGKEAEFINVCPADAPCDGACIVKCCMVKEGHEIVGRKAKVFWGTTVPEVAEAIDALFSE